ncbi:hypothetical protein PNOK_0102600 [Pyrrhoderma noxium]|uniref:Uncharacterized protein n=1 Tax=Pyrrhoderma noxium TaxID=2282107 RepID=A0A286UWK0_9AGAM|nr:hypothetical protein PNOK_0102600 [Pyrrhoderma noxium]
MESSDIPFTVTIHYIPPSSEEREAFSINFEGFVWRVRSLCAQNINTRETVVSSNQEVILFEISHNLVTVTGLQEINNLLNDIHPQYDEEGGEEDVVVKI